MLVADCNAFAEEQVVRKDVNAKAIYMCGAWNFQS
jgi:hypothetical protein